MRNALNRMFALIVAVSGLVAGIAVFPVFAVSLDTSGLPSATAVDIDCSKAVGTLESHVFSSHSSSYVITGKCITTYYKDGSPVVKLAPSFKVVGAWDAMTKEATETITIQPYLEYDDFKQAFDKTSKTRITTTASCPDDPWVNANVACTGSHASVSPTSPQGALEIFTAKHGNHYPASKYILFHEFRTELQAELKKLPPLIKTPTANQKFSGKVDFEADVNPKTITFLKQKPNWDIEAEFLAVSPSGGHQTWSADIKNGTAKQSIPLSVHKWEVHARATDHGTFAGTWSSKRPFEVASLAQYCASMGLPTVQPTKAGTTVSLPVWVENCGSQPWAAAPSGNAIGPVNLSYHWYNATGTSPVAFEGLRTPLNVQPGATGQVTAQIQMPASPGTYTLKWDVVYEGHFWYSQQAGAVLKASYNSLSQKVTVK